MPEFGDVNIVALLGGPFTLAGFVWLARMFISYQHDFTDKYRQELHKRDDRITALEQKVRGLQQRESDYRLRLLDCTRERQALRIEMSRAGIPWDPNLWEFPEVGGDDDGTRPAG